RTSKSRNEIAVLLTVSFLYAFVVYVPFVFSVLNMFVPVWLIQRFEAINVLGFIVFALGVYAVYFYASIIAKKYFEGKKYVRFKNVLIASLVGVVLVVSGYSATVTYGTLLKN